MRQPLRQYLRRLSLRQQMMALMGAFILAASLLAGITYYQLQKQELTRYQRDDLHATLLRAEDLLTGPASNLRSDLMLLARLRATRTLMAGQCSMNGGEPVPGEGCPAMESLGQAFEALLQTHSGYLRARLIGMGGEARELLHVERGADAPRRVTPIEPPRGDASAPPEKAWHLEEDSLALALSAPPGGRVTLSAALPLFAPEGAPFARIVIDLDLAPTLKAVRNLASGGGSLYLATSDGRLLPDQASGTQAPASIKDRLPQLASWLEGRSPDYFDTGPDLTAA
ncbi:MAG TPA: hypothetical protein ENO16_05340, partial [Chromatiales bacterium]|nr:hypothetical protein [Chromatiales bacterium]